jgi:class 3 adenylate cyclase
MPLPPLHKAELLLAVLQLLGERSMSEAELLDALDAALGSEYRVVRHSVLIALAALEAEGLVEAATVRGSPAYHPTQEGKRALGQRADEPVLTRIDRAPRSGGASERSSSHELEQVAVLFTDVVGSTDLLERLGDDAAHQLRRHHFRLLRRAIRDHGGREVKSLGDGLMVVFGRANDAVACALAMQQAVAAGEDPLELRVGIASGETLLEDDDYFGRTVVVARRLCDAARGGDVLISEPIRELMAGSAAVQLDPVGPLDLKGLSEPVPASAVRVPGLALSG